MIRKMKQGLEGKKTVESSSADDRSMPWKLSLIFAPIILLLLPIELTNIYSLILVGVGAVMIYMSAIKIKTFDLSRQWKVVDGELLYKKVAMDNPYAADHAKSYFPYMKYGYKVGSKAYVSDTVANYRELRDFPEEIETLMEKMSTPVLKVYYNPKNPSESILIAKMPLHRKIFWLFIFLLGFISILIGVM